MYYQILQTAIGPYLIVDSGKGISIIEHMHDEDKPRIKKDLQQMEEKETLYLKAAKEQLTEYFIGKRDSFDLIYDVKGTPFQTQVWQALASIPYGEVRTYKQVAAAIDNPKAVRAVGLANNRNPISIVVPCHRVIGSNGKLVGYGGGLEVKEYLLDLELKKKSKMSPL